jgi:type IV secretion system protein VirB10
MAAAAGDERAGFPMRVMANKDLILRPYQPLFFQRGSSQ